ncbi:helix-turn-helix transcriptional regulator [Microlunatus speluncae]|uniref:helix-turn-helix transcriptional regulator n=1 Tax=Microlunatus speluncae TaxID=2594267 RepID=UPI0012665ED4|nr:helix-turn-helix transcriptional regulator [Microlunatus speluncae]
MQNSIGLGDFLRSRRAQLRPADVGLGEYGRRRVPGLRREELAQLAGVSPAYYTRLEQGQSRNASDVVLDALARALRLDDHERAHLHALARPTPPVRRRARPERLRPGLVQLVSTLNVPALVIGRRMDVLAWNRAGQALFDSTFAAGPGALPNLARITFLDPPVRDLFVDWPRQARETVACLRFLAGRHGDDPELTELIGELSLRSDEFAALWSRHRVQSCAHATLDLRHSQVGVMTVDEESLDLPDDPGQRLLLYTAAPGSPSEAALQLLAAAV